MSKWTDQISIFLSLPTDQVLALTAYGEARGEGGEGMMAVLNVIGNRVIRGGWYVDSDIMALTKDPYKAVCLMKYQFSIFNPGDPNLAVAQKIASNFDNYVSSDSNLQMAYDLAQMLINGELPDNTGGADYYYNPSLANPSWASKYTQTAQIGSQVFLASSPMASVAQAAVGVVAAAGEQVSQVIQSVAPQPIAEVVETVSEAVGTTISQVISSDPETQEEVKQTIKSVTPITMIGLVGAIIYLIYKNIR